MPRMKINPTARLRADTRGTVALITNLYKPRTRTIPQNEAEQQAAKIKEQIDKKNQIKIVNRAQYKHLFSKEWRSRHLERVHEARNKLVFVTDSWGESIRAAVEELIGPKKKFRGMAFGRSKRTYYTKPPKGYYQERGYMRALIAHEVTHVLGVSKNHKTTAETISSYLTNLKTGREKKIIHSNLMEYEPNIRAVESAFNGWRKSTTEHDKFDGRSQSQIGKMLGGFAAELEHKLGKPGVGGIFIREISKGVFVRNALNKAESGAYDAEGLEWIERSKKVAPMLTKFHFGK
jgi:hypothetical protein